jgi:hypothetical protein
MTYTIGWGVEDATVSTPGEAEEVLDRIAATGRRHLVHVAHKTGTGGLIEMVWGDPERAMLSYADDDWDGQAVEPGMPLATEDLGYDYGSIEPDRTRLSARCGGTARRSGRARSSQPDRRALVEESATGLLQVLLNLVDLGCHGVSYTWPNVRLEDDACSGCDREDGVDGLLDHCHDLRPLAFNHGEHSVGLVRQSAGAYDADGF